MLTVLVDYDSGNLHSAEKAFQRRAQETGAGDRLQFHIEAAVPLIGVVASYRGYLLLPKESA